jgi:hypothetical protein
MSGGNPKDFVGASKAPLSTISRRVMHELGLAMFEGECQYWRHNYRAAEVRAMVYLDAMGRHVSAWIEGQDIDPKSGLSHLVKAMACLHIIRDAQLYGSLIDDRPPAQDDLNWIDELNAKALAIVKSTEHLQRGAFTEANRSEWPAMCLALDNGPILKEELGSVRTRLGETKGPPIDAFVHYVPKAGERVRVVEVAEFDEEPKHSAGVEYDVRAGSGLSEAYRNWFVLFSPETQGGTYCRVEPV